MGTFLFLLLFFFIILPLCQIALKVWRFNRRWKEATREMRDAYNKAQEQADDLQNKQKKKKIDPSVGEYISFEEINIETTSTTDTSSETKTSTYIKVESQIEDADWEEIK